MVISVSLVFLWWNIQPETQEKLLLWQKIFFAVSVMIKLNLTLTSPHDYV